MKQRTRCRPGDLAGTSPAPSLVASAGPVLNPGTIADFLGGGAASEDSGEIAGGSVLGIRQNLNGA